MKTSQKIMIALAAVTLLTALAIGENPFTACTAPVSDEATVSVEGRVLDTDGNPLAGVMVRLKKTDLDVLDVDWVVGTIVNVDAQPFMEVQTDANGSYFFEFSGAEANSKNQMWAAYFVSYVVHPDDPDNQLAVATDSFQFSNNSLNKNLGDLQFFDIPEGGVTVEGDKVNVWWDPSPLAPIEGKYVVNFEGTRWVEEVDGTSFELPLSALEPCTQSVIDDPSECVARDTHRVQIISLTDGMRYRTAWHTFSATNPKGLGLWFRDESDNTSGHTCSGKVLFDINDGIFSGENGVQFVGDLGKDFRCVTIDLGAPKVLDEIYLHNGTIWFHKQAQVQILTSDLDEPTDDDFSLLTDWNGQSSRFWYVNLQVPGNDTLVRWIKVNFIDTSEAVWNQIGEITVYGDDPIIE